MKKILFSGLLIASLAVCAEDRQIKLSPEQMDNLGIKVGTLAASGQVPLLYAPATVVVPASREMLISSLQAGVLAQMQANIGDRVDKGQLLAQLNSPELVSDQQQFLTALSESALASREYRRDKLLLQEGVIAERRLQETQTLHDGKQAKVDEARQLLGLAGMSKQEIDALAKSRKLDNRLNIRAPIAGVVLERLATVGASLDALAPLYRIADVSELWLEINIPQERLSQIKLGNRVKVEDSTATGSISLLGQSVNPQNQTVLARAVVDHPDGQLRVGQRLNVEIVDQSGQTGFSVPNSAIAQNAGHNYIFVRNRDGFAVTEVKVLGKHDQQTLIEADLKAGESIALEGAVALKANWLGLGGDE